MDCTECKNYVSAFVDGELDQKTLDELNQHISHCDDCQAAVQAERRIKNLLIDSYHPEKAPFTLRAGVRQELAKKGAKANFFQLLIARPVAALITTLVVIFLLTVVYQIYRSGQISEQWAENNKVHLHGHIDCINCYLAKHDHAKNYCSEYGHYYGLITDTGEIYSFVQNELSNEIQSHPEYAHNDVKIDGWVFHQANFIEIDNYQILGQTLAFDFLK